MIDSGRHGKYLTRGSFKHLLRQSAFFRRIFTHYGLEFGTSATAPRRLGVEAIYALHYQARSQLG
tara:strand:+ start:350 stop:544 length:195 start_codon:yes stop_codon:yes gene_type:complete